MTKVYKTGRDSGQSRPKYSILDLRRSDQNILMSLKSVLICLISGSELLADLLLYFVFTLQSCSYITLGNCH